MQSSEGKNVWKAESHTKHVHLQCALEYQAQHGLLADSKEIAGRILQLQQFTKP